LVSLIDLFKAKVALTLLLFKVVREAGDSKLEINAVVTIQAMKFPRFLFFTFEAMQLLDSFS